MHHTTPNFVSTLLGALLCCGCVAGLPPPGQNSPDANTITTPPPSPPGAVATLQPGQVYILINVQSGLALDAPDSATDVGAPLVQHDLLGVTSQLWKVTANANSTVSLVNFSTSQCADLAQPALNPNIPLQQAPCASIPTQAWSATADGNGIFKLANGSSGLFVDVNNNSTISGAAVIQAVASNSNTQRWAFHLADPTPQPQWFWAGADAGTVIRAQAIPGRVFYDFDGNTIRDPFDVMQDSNLNAVRVESSITTCSGPSPPFDNSGDVLGRELNFELDGGCIDIQVQTAQRAKARGMKVELTLNMGFDIPVAWQNYTYTQMLGAIDAEVQRQLMPYLQAGIQPDIILLENEGTDGILYNVTLPTGEVHVRGTSGDHNVLAAQLRQEICGQLPTGNMASYPQLAGYYKQEVLSSRRVIELAGFDNTHTRFGLHSHGQYIDWKQSVVYSTNPNLETLYSGNGITCDFNNVIPQNILNLRAADLLDIMGFSSYANPITPVNPNSLASIQATFTRLNTTLGLMNKVAKRYGKYTNGPFEGQYIKQGMGVEYASGFSYPDQIADQQRHTQIYLQTLQSYPWFLGALWWEPTYVYNNWEGGQGTLYFRTNSSRDQTGEAPTATMKTWGSFAQSPP